MAAVDLMDLVRARRLLLLYLLLMFFPTMDVVELIDLIQSRNVFPLYLLFCLDPTSQLYPKSLCPFLFVSLVS